MREGLPNLEELKKYQKDQAMIVIDDLMTKIDQNSGMERLVSVLAHHYNMTVIIGISLVSKKCKNLVNSIGIKSEPIKCKIARSIELGFVFNGTGRLFLEFNIKDKEDGKYVLKRPSETVEIRFQQNGLQLARYTLSENHMEKSLKELNMFLKLWMNGSNPNLEYITFRYLDWNKEDANTIMKGIKNQRMPRTLARKHRCFNWIVYGGFDIHRYDGVKATVLVGRTAEGQACFKATMDVPRFPLMRLPVVCSQMVLRILIPNQLIGISLLSKKCKNLVQSVGIKTKPIVCRVCSESIKLEVKVNEQSSLGLKFFIKDKENGKYVLEKPCAMVKIWYKVELLKLSENQMELKEWLEHLRFLFGCSKAIEVIFLKQSFEFDIHSLRETFQEVRHLYISHSGCYSYNELILQKFLPVESLTVSPRAYRNSKISNDILIQNFGTICIVDPNEEQLTNLKLNDWLIMNSKVIDISNLQKSMKEFNMFLKLWIQGSNPNLEFISFRYSNWNDEDCHTVMKGIQYQVMPWTYERDHQSSSYIIRGGKDFHRHDGVKATVVSWESGAGEGNVTMLVWHDHCIVP
ncbi:unnamed protein product [Caenorhabditis brenneri]